MKPLIRVIYIRIFFAVLVLIFTISVAGCLRKRVVELPPLPKKPETVQVTVYAPTGDGLVGENREIPKKDYKPEIVLRELIVKEDVPPSDRPFQPFLPSGTKIISLKVKDGLATVNFSRNVLNVEGPEKLQRYAVLAIVETLTQFPHIKKVKFQVEGRESGKIGKRNIEDWWGEVTLREQPWE